MRKALVALALSVAVSAPAVAQTRPGVTGYSSIPSPKPSKTQIIVVTPPIIAPPMTGPFIFSGPGKRTVVCSWIVGVGWLCTK